MDIKKYIKGVTKLCEMYPSFYSVRHSLYMPTDEAVLKCNRQGSYENDFCIEAIDVVSV